MEGKSFKRIYTIGKEDHNKESLIRILRENPYIKFVSISGIDLAGHETDEKIPVKEFIKDIDNFLYKTAVQTDGSSVILPGIATLNNAKIDMVVDKDATWWIDYNGDLIDEKTNIEVATIKIPCFLYHENIAVDSRSILKRARDYFQEELFKIIKENPSSIEYLGIGLDEIKGVIITSATELEFWVMSPEDKRDLEELSASQELKEQYWARTKGNVRNALEKTLLLMEDYGLNPEMGHKEVGGVKARLGQDRSYHGIMEQLEIDWKFSTALQCADNEIWVKHLIKEVFRKEGMEVTYLAKPLDNVAGSGEHTHMGAILELKDGRKLNLFSGEKGHFMSSFGYGAIMGILRNYEILSPFIVQSIDSLRRLKKGYEAPVCIVTSLGHTPETPSRNRTVLLGLIRDNENPMATRFELRSPNPHTNTYLCISILLLAMIDGIDFTNKKKMTEDMLLNELSKKPGEDALYLEKDRAYRSEEDVFESFTDEERDRYFGSIPRTIYESLLHFEKYKDRLRVLLRGGVISEKIIESFRIYILNKWKLELLYRVLPKYEEEVKGMKLLHKADYSNDLDLARWIRIRDLRNEAIKDRENKDSLATKIRDAFSNSNYKLASDLQVELQDLMLELKKAYKPYKRNIID